MSSSRRLFIPHSTGGDSSIHFRSCDKCIEDMLSVEQEELMGFCNAIDKNSCFFWVVYCILRGESVNESEMFYFLDL